MQGIRRGQERANSAFVAVVLGEELVQLYVIIEKLKPIPGFATIRTVLDPNNTVAIALDQEMVRRHCFLNPCMSVALGNGWPSTAYRPELVHNVISY